MAEEPPGALAEELFTRLARAALRRRPRYDYAARRTTSRPQRPGHHVGHQANLNAAAGGTDCPYSSRRGFRWRLPEYRRRHP
jgi:hypothetical protein